MGDMRVVLCHANGDCETMKLLLNSLVTLPLSYNRLVASDGTQCHPYGTRNGVSEDLYLGHISLGDQVRYIILIRLFRWLETQNGKVVLRVLDLDTDF